MTGEDKTYTKQQKFCCRMRAKFLLGIVGADDKVDIPEIDLVDFIIDWEGTKPLIGIIYCPFCGKKIDYSTQQLRDTRGMGGG